MKYYSLDKIKKIKDLDGLQPSIFLITTNRSGGKTTAVLTDFLDNFLKDGSEFVLIYRHKYELKACHEIFSDIIQRKYPNSVIDSQSVAQGLFYTITWDKDDKKTRIGFAVCMTNADEIKKYSPMFLNVRRALFDEFQLENGKYLKDEPKKLLSIIISISRGGGSQARDIDLYMLGNNISILNPYYISFGIVERLKPETRFLRGHGWILEQGFNKSASDEINKNAIVRAFSEKEKCYTTYLSSKDYLLNMDAFIRKQSGKSRYLCTLEYGEKRLGVREFFESGCIHVNEKIESNSYYNFAFTPNDHNQNTMMLTRASFIFKLLQNAYNTASLTFETLEIKNIIFELLGIDLYR
nr:MAG TPA: Terminase [Caudoviricetes sp.]